MKRFFSISFILLALIVGIAGAAHAQFYDAMGNSYPTQEAANAADDTNNAREAQYAQPVRSDQYAATYAAQNGATPEQQIAQAGKPASTEPPDKAYNYVMQKILELFAWLLGVSALTLNYAVYYTVVIMGSYVKNLAAIGITWAILRDIGNIFLIFGFLAVGVTTILNVDWYGGGKKMLPMMFVAAVFLNFSLFFTEAIIDVGNLFATRFYTQINGGTPITGAPTATMESVTREGISNKIMNQLGLQTIYGNGKGNPDIFNKNSPWLIGFMGILLFIVTAFVMFALAFVLIARFIILIFLIILSPIGFAGLAVPMLAKRAKQWWDKLFEQTIIAPILLLMLYIALRVITDAHFLTGLDMTVKGGASTGFIGDSNLPHFAGFILSFIVAMGFLIAVVIQAKNLGAIGAATIMKFGQSAAMGTVKFAGRSALGAGRWGVNRTAGFGAHRASQAIMRSDFGQTQFGRLAATGFGKAGAGYKEAKEKTLKKHEDYQKSVGAAIDEKHAANIISAQQMRSNAEKNKLDTTKEMNSAASYVNRLKTEKTTVEKTIADTRAEVLKHPMEEKKAALDERDQAAAEAKPFQDEVARLQKVVDGNNARFVTGPEAEAAEQDLANAKTAAAPAEAALQAADRNLADKTAAVAAVEKDVKSGVYDHPGDVKTLENIMRELAPAIGRLAEATEEFEKADKRVKITETVEKRANDAATAEKKEKKLAYGENVATPLGANPATWATWAMTGVSAQAAANKIIKETLTKMTDEQKMLDAFRKVIEKEAKAADKSAKINGALNSAKTDLAGKVEAEAESH